MAHLFLTFHDTRCFSESPPPGPSAFTVDSPRCLGLRTNSSPQNKRKGPRFEQLGGMAHQLLICVSPLAVSCLGRDAGQIAGGPGAVVASSSGLSCEPVAVR